MDDLFVPLVVGCPSIAWSGWTPPSLSSFLYSVRPSKKINLSSWQRPRVGWVPLLLRSPPCAPCEQGRQIPRLNIHNLSELLALPLISLLKVGKPATRALLFQCFFNLILASLSALLVQRHKWYVRSVEVEGLLRCTLIFVSDPGGWPSVGWAGYGEDGGSIEVGVRVPGSSRGKVTRLSEGQVRDRERERRLREKI